MVYPTKKKDQVFICMERAEVCTGDENKLALTFDLKRVHTRTPAMDKNSLEALAALDIRDTSSLLLYKENVTSSTRTTHMKKVIF